MKRKKLSRRMFLGQCAVSPFVVTLLGSGGACFAEDSVPAPALADSPEIGKPYAGWKEGDLDLHFISQGKRNRVFKLILMARRCFSMQASSTFRSRKARRICLMDLVTLENGSHGI